MKGLLNIADLMKCVIGEAIAKKTDASCTDCIVRRIKQACDDDDANMDNISDECIAAAAENKVVCDQVIDINACAGQKGCAVFNGACVEEKCIPPCAKIATTNPKKFKKMAKECSKDAANQCSWDTSSNSCVSVCKDKGDAEVLDFSRVCSSDKGKSDCKKPCQYKKKKCSPGKKLKKMKCKKLKMDDCCSYNGCYLAHSRKGPVCAGKFKM
eukprot:TRINITY_DN971_c0_g1_i2.p1 TRINITY_DN971_c0_g1~~TRINITY_DN971_c0_g1_i2.p1  ORF type:complete len:212 (+),score=71.36 TRINITY_DN971_c0_g1_i2:275-910(+)